MDVREDKYYIKLNSPKFPGFGNHHGKLHAAPRDVQGVGHTLGHCSGKTSAQQFGRHCQHQTTCTTESNINLKQIKKQKYLFT